MKNYNVIDIKDLNKNAFLHYTALNNINNIFTEGLEPRIGDNSEGVEKNEKVFFTIGLTNTLILMESWIKWLIAKSAADLPGKKFDKLLYKIATYMLKLKIFQPLMTFIVKCELKDKYRRKKAYKILNEIMENSVFLNLNLIENIDYNFENVDEIKTGNFNKKLLKIMYSSKSNVNDSYMEFWNMHTIPNKTIEANKIKLVKINDSYKASDILEYMRLNSEIKIRKELPFLYKYFKWIKNNQKNN